MVLVVHTVAITKYNEFSVKCRNTSGYGLIRRLVVFIAADVRVWGAKPQPWTSSSLVTPRFDGTGLTPASLLTQRYLTMRRL
jgi:hypothetical protein